MALTYTEFSCSNCHKVLYYLPNDERDTGYGSKLQICPHCCRTYFDKTKVEIELDGVRFADEAVITPIMILSVCIGFVFLLISFPNPYALTFSGLWFAISIGGCVHDAKTYQERQVLLKIEAAASRQRLYDLDYLSFLVAHRVKVPQKYFDEACKYLEDHPDP